MTLPSDSAEEALRQSQAEFLSLVDSLPVCLMRKNRDGQPVFANQPYLDFHGLTLEQLVADGPPAVTFDPDWQVRIAKEDQEALAAGTVFRGVIQHQQQSDGTKCWVERLKGPQCDADGKIVGVQVLFWVVTDRVEAEEAHRRESALLQTLLKSVPDAIYFKDASSQYLRISESMAQMLGLTFASDAVGRTDADFFPAQQARQAREDEQRIMRSGESIVGRIERQIWPTGPSTWASCTKLPLRNSDGETIGTFGLSRDVTDVIQVEEELVRERDRLQTLMNHLPDVIFIKDRRGRFLVTNPALNRFYGGKSSHQLKGRTDFDFVPDELARKFADDDQRVMQSGQPLIDREEFNVDQHGEVFCLLTSKIPLRDTNGEVVGLVGIGRDITKLKRAQQAAARKAMEAGLLYEATTLARDTDSLEEALRGCLAIVCDLTSWDVGHVLRPAVEDSSDPVNHLLQDQDQDQHSDVQQLESMKIWHPATRPGLSEFRQLVETSLTPKSSCLSGSVWQTGEPKWIADLPAAVNSQSADVFRRAGIRSGVAFPVMIQDHTVAILEFFAFDHQPEDIGLMALFQRVGEQVGRVIERRRSEQAMRAAVQAADAANRAKSDFLANVSHEIRTPMNGVIGMTELLLETKLTATQREYLSMVQTSGEALLELINDILDFSKIESGRMELEKIPFDIRESLGDTMKTLGTRAHEKGLELAFSIHPQVPGVLIGDPSRLRQVVINLVGNAIKFTSRGEVVLRVVCVHQQASQVRLQISVADTGIGIPEDQIEAVFAAFHQADTSTTRSFGGTGLGLTISTRIVEMMDGTLKCESVEGSGSVFTFEAVFPVAAVAADQVPAPVVVRGTRTLIVDDNATNRRILQEMCTNWGMQPVAVANAEQALEALTNNHPETPFVLMLSDVNMPRMDGFELCERIRRDERFSELKIMMLTSAGRPGDAERRQLLRISEHLLKPVKQSELFDGIVTALGVNQAEHEERVSVPAAETCVPVQGLKVLLAEDNLVNQKLATGLLQKLGHDVTLASDGQQAVDLYKAQRFDVVLMDVQMPRLDGLEATAAIREHEQSVGFRTTIVAMTAHAMKGDRERCLQAGMDEYLSKPIRGRQLADKFAELCLQPTVGSAEQSGEAASNRDALSNSDAKISDNVASGPIVDWDQALESVDGDRDLLKEVINAFLQECPGLVAQASSAIAGNDAKTLHRTGHTIKGALLSLGVPSVAELAKTLESIGAAGSTDKADEVMQQLTSQLHFVRQQFTEFVKR